MHNRLDREYRRVTDGQTSCHGIVCAMHTRRAVETVGYDIPVKSTSKRDLRGHNSQAYIKVSQAPHVWYLIWLYCIPVFINRKNGGSFFRLPSIDCHWLYLMELARNTSTYDRSRICIIGSNATPILQSRGGSKGGTGARAPQSPKLFFYKQYYIVVTYSILQVSRDSLY